jgi:hypothetical protein
MVESRAGAVDGARPGGASGAELDDALQGLRDVLGADGYRLDYAVHGDRELVVSVLAGPDACADCLVPRQVMEGILADALQETPYTVARVEMPADNA